MPSLKELFCLKNKLALVTGGAGYLGTEITWTLAELAGNLIIASRDTDKCQRLCQEIKSKFTEIQVNVMQLDLTSRQSIKETFNIINDQFGGLDILVNNAGTSIKNSFESISDDDWDYDIELNINSVFRCVKAAWPGLKKNKGVILNIGSMYGHVAPDYRNYTGNLHANPPSYGAAKAGVIQFTKYLASFLALDGIRVNCISPGPFPTPATQKDEEFVCRLSACNPLNRIGRPYEIKGAIALLCSDASSYMTGQNICIDGGWAAW